MEARVAVLEKSSLETREALIRVEARLDNIEQNMATKIDIAEMKTNMADMKASMADMKTELRTAMAEGFTSQTKWSISTAVALAVIAFTAAKFIH